MNKKRKFGAISYCPIPSNKMRKYAKLVGRKCTVYDLSPYDREAIFRLVDDQQSKTCEDYHVQLYKTEIYITVGLDSIQVAWKASEL